MTNLEAALFEMTDLLDGLRLTIWVEPDQFESTVELFAARLPLRTADPLGTARRLRLLPVRASNGVPVDLLFADSNG